MVASNVLRLFLFGFTPPGAGSLSFDFSLQSRCWSLKVEGAVGRGTSSLSKVHLLLPRGERVRGWGTLCTCLIFTVTAWEGCGINYFFLSAFFNVQFPHPYIVIGSGRCSPAWGALPDPAGSSGMLVTSCLSPPVGTG